MNLALIIFLFLLGLALIIKGGDFFVDAAGWIAEASGVPKFIVGATVVSFAASLPELLVSVIAAAQGTPDMAVGNAVGNVTANLGLIMGLSVLGLPAFMRRASLAFKGALMMIACALLLFLARGGSLRTMGAVSMLAIFLIFVFESILDAKLSSGARRRAREPFPKEVILKNVAKFLLGLAGIIIGARLLVNQGSDLALRMGVSQAVISVTLLAIGTSLPELVTTIAALIKRQSSLSIGSIVGANVIDLTLILPLCSLISGKSLPISAQATRLDLPVCLLLCILAITPPMLMGRFRRWQGAVMLCLYLIYIAIICLTV